MLPGASLRFGDVTDPQSLEQDGFRGESFDVLVSCLASRTGAPEDAWAIDHKAHIDALAIARETGVSHMVLLSAICVQKPRLAFQHAKLAFEQALIGSGVTYSVVRPTAYFKSLTGQIDRVRQGKSYLVFGDGRLTACKPISDRDLGQYMAMCLDREDMQNAILPIGGPGPALTPLDVADHMFDAVERPKKVRHVPVGLLRAIIAVLSLAGKLMPRLAQKAQLAQIGHYYATESMLVLDHGSGEYRADATPETGKDILPDFIAELARGETDVERGDHAVF